MLVKLLIQYDDNHQCIACIKVPLCYIKFKICLITVDMHSELLRFINLHMCLKRVKLTSDKIKFKPAYIR